MSEIRIGKTQSGGSIQAKPGDEIVISLPENPTTGYRWAVETGGEPALQQAGASYEQSAGRGVGGGGQRVLRFRAANAGRANLSLVLRQEWQPGEVAERFHLSVDVAR